MKISAERLKRIIREEVQHVREIGPEDREPSTGATDDTWNALKAIHYALVGTGKPTDEGFVGELYGLVDPDAVQGGDRTGSNLSTYGDELAEKLQKIGDQLGNIVSTLAEGIKEPRR